MTDVHRELRDAREALLMVEHCADDSAALARYEAALAARNAVLRYGAQPTGSTAIVADLVDEAQNAAWNGDAERERVAGLVTARLVEMIEQPSTAGRDTR